MCHNSLEHSEIDVILPEIFRKDNYLFYMFYHYICLIILFFIDLNIAIEVIHI